MKEIENNIIKEKCYTNRLENGLQVIIVPKKIFKKSILYGLQNLAL